MSANRQCEPSHAAKPRRRRAWGFTLVTTAVSTVVAGIMIAGGWMSYASMLRQWKIGNAEREMDQYAASAMQELTNDISQSWAGRQLVGGNRATRWKFMFDDRIDEDRNYARTRLGSLRDPEDFIVFNYTPVGGLMVGGRVPPWAGDRWHSQYRWVGGAPRRGETRSFDRRDKMTVEGLQMEFIDFTRASGYRAYSIEDRVRRQGIVHVEMTMQYTYRATSPLSDMGLYGGYYVRERKYQTDILLRNWDTDGNTYRDSLIAHAG